MTVLGYSQFVLLCALAKCQSDQRFFDQMMYKGAFTLARFRGRFRTKLACLVMKKYFFCNKTC